MLAADLPPPLAAFGNRWGIRQRPVLSHLLGDTSAPMPSAVASLFAQPGFARYWFSRVGSQLSMQMLAVALGWQMYELTGSAWDLGLVGLAQFLPALLLALPAGHAVDRLNRNTLLLASFGVMAGVAGVLALAAEGGWVSRGLILGVSIAVGVVKAFQMPTQQSILPLLVSAPLLPRALAVNASGTQSAIIVGPALGGFVYAFGAPLTYALCLVVTLVALSLAVRLPLAPGARSTEPTSWRTVLAGVAYIRERPVLLGAISLDLFAVLLGGATALLPIYAKEVLHTGPLGLGLLRGAPAVGALLSSLWLGRRPIQRQAGHKLFTAVAIFGLATLVFAVSTSMALSLFSLAVSGAADMISVVVRQSMVQLDTPNEMRGRVSAVSSIFIGASNQLGEFESGATAAWLGPVGSVLLGGAGTLVVCGLWLRLFPALWARDRLQDDARPR